MADFPEDIFTEPADVDPDTLANLGPLRKLAGKWQGRKGVDLSPKEDGPERREYIETMDFVPIDPQANGPQLLYGLRYHLHITTLEEDITFHDQVGYWLWEPATGLIMQTIAIPRGQSVLASGHALPESEQISVAATRGETDYGICSTAFLEHAFRTDSYSIEISFNTDGSFSYVTRTMLQVRGRPEPFDHRDANTLHRIGAPKPNPLMAILTRRSEEAAGKGE